MYKVTKTPLVAIGSTPPIPKPWNLVGPNGLVGCFKTWGEAQSAKHAAERNDKTQAR